MECPQCQFPVKAGAKYCGRCGAPLDRLCPRCQTLNPANYHFCHECGAPLDQEAKGTAEGKLELPDALMKLLPANEVVRVIILVSEPTDMEEQAAWSRLTAEQFFTGYSEADAVYDSI